jgi:LysR family D-serine deaminase transcriptional activator
LYCSREHVQRPRYQAFAQWLQRTIDEWQEIKEASLSAEHPFIYSGHAIEPDADCFCEPT